MTYWRFVEGLGQLDGVDIDSQKFGAVR